MLVNFTWHLTVYLFRFCPSGDSVIAKNVRTSPIKYNIRLRTYIFSINIVYKYRMNLLTIVKEKYNTGRLFCVPPRLYFFIVHCSKGFCKDKTWSVRFNENDRGRWRVVPTVCLTSFVTFYYTNVLKRPTQKSENLKSMVLFYFLTEELKRR